MITVNTDVINFVQSIGCGVFGKDLFLGRVPNSNKTDEKLWWLVPITSTMSKHNPTGEDTLSYDYDICYRNVDLKAVEEEIFRITKAIVGSHCYTLQHFSTVNIELTSVAQYEIDPENRVYGKLSFRVTVYDILDQTNAS